MSDQSITDYIASYDLHETLDLIYKDFIVSRVVTYLLQFSDSFNTSL